MNLQTFFYPESKFGGFTDIDGTIAFFMRVNALVNSGASVLDVGCGRGEYADDPIDLRRNLRILKGKASQVVGIDVDSAASANPFLTEFRLIEAEHWPINDSSIDLVICDNVIEHLDNVKPFFREACRVLKPGGVFCARTPNRWSYISLAASLIPNRYHSRITKRVQTNRKEEDVFPTFYRCNTKRSLRQMLSFNGFEELTVYTFESEPQYLSFSFIAYSLGYLHQLFSPSFFKPVIFAFARKR
jgi:SAM-dependent methyltransferase